MVRVAAELAILVARGDYVVGRIGLAEFERRVGAALRVREGLDR